MSKVMYSIRNVDERVITTKVFNLHDYQTGNDFIVALEDFKAPHCKSNGNYLKRDSSTLYGVHIEANASDWEVWGNHSYIQTLTHEDQEFIAISILEEVKLWFNELKEIFKSYETSNQASPKVA